jgi:fatty-acyl-CoA synthase
VTEPQASPATYVDHILANVAAHGDREALVHGGRRFSYADAGAMIYRLAAALRQRGAAKGDAIALLSGNSPEALLTGLAVHLLGCRLVFTPPEAASRERGAFIRRADTAVLVADPRLAAGAGLAHETGTPRVLTLGPGETGEDLIALAATMDATRPAGCAAPDDVSTVFHTGGTTGRPKMVLHRHPYYDALIFGADRRYFFFPEPYRFLVPTPLSHTSGHICALVTLLAGGTVVLLDGFDAAAVIDAIEREAISSTMMVPAMLYELLDHPDLPAGGFATLSRLNYGGAPSSQSRLRQAMRRLGPILRQTYALTEAPTIAVLLPEDHDESVPGRLSACGKPMPALVEVSLREESAEVAPGEVGEICVRGPLVMTEYLKDPELTRQMIRDGWLHTGDLGRFDDDGYLHIVDRVNEVIISGNRAAGVYAANVYTNLLVDVLTEAPGVRGAAAVGIADDQYGEAVHVVCVTEPGAKVDAEELKKRVVAALGPTYEPRTVTFAGKLPYTALGKPDKQALRRLIAAS